MDALLFILHHSHPFLQRWIVRLCPQTWLIRICRHTRTQEDLHVAPCVLRLFSQIAAQYGVGVWPSRGTMQEYAYQHVDPVIVRLPQVYRFLIDYSTGYSLPDGYLFMEYIPGKSVAELDADTENYAVGQALIPRIANIVVHLQGIKAEDGDPPGPVGGGMPFGYLWGDEGAGTVFHSTSELNAWLNKRLKLIGKSIDLGPCYPLVLCHGDLVRRNIIAVDNGSDEKTTKTEDYKGRQLALVDWGHAALLPRVYEVAAMLCYNDTLVYPFDKTANSYWRELPQATREAIGGLTEVEEECLKLLMSARALSLRYTRFD